MQTMDPKYYPESEAPTEAELPAYEPPVVSTYTDEQLLEALGPAQAGGTYNIFAPP